MSVRNHNDEVEYSRGSMWKPCATRRRLHNVPALVQLSAPNVTKQAVTDDQLGSLDSDVTGRQGLRAYDGFDSWESVKYW